MRHNTENPIEYGRFRDPPPGREYVVTGGRSADNIRVWTVEPEPELVCTIFNVSLVPLASWNARWIDGLRHWKLRLVEQAAAAYRAHRAKTTGA